MDEFRGTKIRPDVVITGEAVALLVQPVSVFYRVAAGIIDALVSVIGIGLSFELIFLFPKFVLNTTLVLRNIAQFSAVSTVVVALWILLIPMVIETLTRGRSLGKFVMGTRVVRDDGGAVSLRHVIVRCVIGVAELWFTFGAPALIVSMFNRRSKRIGDFFAGTYVVLEPSVITRIPLVMAPELAVWANSVTVGEISDSLSIMARRFLQTAGQMQPQPRRNLALRLATDLEKVVYPPPPPNTDPERFIAAVLVLRRDAHYHVQLNRRENIERKLSVVAAGRYGI